MRKICLVLLLFTYTAAHAADWKPVIDAPDMKVWVDQSSLAQAGKYKKAWFRTWRSVDQQGNAYTTFKTYRWTKQLEYFSCQERTSSALQMLYYTGDVTSGEYIGSSSIKLAQASFDEIAPDTVGEQMLSFVCTAKK